MFTKGIQAKLNKFLKKLFTPEEIDRMEWYVDEVEDYWYHWTFSLDNQMNRIAYNRNTGQIVHYPVKG